MLRSTTARAIELEPTSVFVLNHAGALRLLQGRVPQALQTFHKVTQHACRLAGTGSCETLAAGVGGADAQYAEEAAFQTAETFAWLGEKDQAFEWLERSYKQRDAGLSFFRNDVLLKSLHSDPRFNALLRKLKLPELTT